VKTASPRSGSRSPGSRSRLRTFQRFPGRRLALHLQDASRALSGRARGSVRSGRLLGALAARFVGKSARHERPAHQHHRHDASWPSFAVLWSLAHFALGPRRGCILVDSAWRRTTSPTKTASSRCAEGAGRPVKHVSHGDPTSPAGPPWVPTPARLASLRRFGAASAPVGAACAAYARWAILAVARPRARLTGSGG